MSSRTHAIVVASALCWSLGASVAKADGTQDVGIAQGLYEQATRLMDADRFAEACPKLEAVTRLVPDGLGAKLELAECYERDGKLASAWSQYSSAAMTAALTGQTERHDRAAQRATDLWPRLSTIAVHVSTGARATEGLVVSRDGIVLEPGQWEIRVPVDAGEHLVGVEAPAMTAHMWRVNVDHDGVAIDVTIDPSLGVTSAAALPDDAGRWQRRTGYIVGGAGLATAAVGFAFAGLALAKANEARTDCNAGLVCSYRGLALRASGKTFGDAATALLVIGGASTVVGIVLVVTPHRARSVKVGLGPGFASLQRTF